MKKEIKEECEQKSVSNCCADLLYSGKIDEVTFYFCEKCKNHCNPVSALIRNESSRPEKSDTSKEDEEPQTWWCIKDFAMIRSGSSVRGTNGEKFVRIEFKPEDWPEYFSKDECEHENLKITMDGSLPKCMKCNGYFDPLTERVIPVKEECAVINIPSSFVNQKNKRDNKEDDLDWEEEFVRWVPHHTECFKNKKCKCSKPQMEREIVLMVTDLLFKSQQQERERCADIVRELQPTVTYFTEEEKKEAQKLFDVFKKIIDKINLQNL